MLNMRSRELAVVTLLVGASPMMFASNAAAFEPPADPQDKFTCTSEGPVPGHPGFPGIANGVEKSFGNSDGNAAAAWSGTVLFHGPLDVC
jgi:hypothetical protein